jgi:TonB family protein
MTSLKRFASLSLLALVLSALVLPPALAQKVSQRKPGETLEQLLERADAAQKAGQVFDPAVGNAFALYLEVLEDEEAQQDGKMRRLSDSMAGGGPKETAQYALTELFPQGLKRAEEGIRDGDLVESGRVVEMLERAQKGSVSVQRLRDAHAAALKAARESLRSTDPDRLPMLASSRPPTYPPRALRQGTTGWVHLAFTIRTDGSVVDIKVMAAEPSGVFERDSVKALEQWKFEAPSAPIRAQQRFDFEL